MWPNGLHLQLNTCPYPALLRIHIDLRILSSFGGVAGGWWVATRGMDEWTLSDARHSWQGALAVVQRAPHRLRSRSSLELCAAFSLETRRWCHGARISRTRRALQTLLRVACRKQESLPL